MTEPAEPPYEADRDMEAPSEVGDTALTEARIRRGKAERLRGLIRMEAVRRVKRPAEEVRGRKIDARKDEREKTKRRSEAALRLIVRQAEKEKARSEKKADKVRERLRSTLATRYERHDCGPRVECEYCGAKVWHDEQLVGVTTKDGLSRPTRNCCRGGTYVLGPQFNPPISLQYAYICSRYGLSRLLNARSNGVLF